MRTFLVSAKEKKIEFHSDTHRAMFLDFLSDSQKGNKKIKIEWAKNPVSDKLRSWYWGAIIPTIKSAIPEWQSLQDDDVHEICKKMFEYFDFYNPLTKRTERCGRSVMGRESNTVRSMAYIEKIQEYFAENYNLTLPSPEEWKEARDSAPMYNEK